MPRKQSNPLSQLPALPVLSALPPLPAYNGIRGCYLLHFSKRLAHAGHYLGWAEDIGRRVQEHEFGKCKVRIILAALKVGINFHLVRVWTGADVTAKTERKLKGSRQKRTGSLARLCPVCRAEKAYQKSLPKKVIKGSPIKGSPTR